jgi:predicted nuclease with TOPRIM domain
MAHLEEKIDAILQKAEKLIEQNNQYRVIVQDLSNKIKFLETENSALRVELTIKNQNSDLALDKEKLKRQIDKYLHEIDQSIHWLSDLE